MTSMVEARFAAWKEENFGRVRAEGVEQGRAEGVERGHAEGVAEGVGRQRAMLSRLATRRFGADAGQAVAAAVAGVEDEATLERVGDLIVDCPTGERLRDALAGVVGPPNARLSDFPCHGP